MEKFLKDYDSATKIAYAKALCNFAFVERYSEVAVIQIAELFSLMARNGFSDGERREIVSYIDEGAFQDDAALKLTDRDLQWSLVKDMLYLNYKKGRQLDCWANIRQIVDLSRQFGISDGQIGLMAYVIKTDADVVLSIGAFRDSLGKKLLDDIAAKSAAVAMPITTVYVSGSVLGLSASGITSGLAAIGLGGLLGFNAMTTGIGVAVLMGMGTNHLVKKFLGNTVREQRQRQSRILRDMVSNRCSALKHLIAASQRSKDDFNKRGRLYLDAAGYTLEAVDKYRKIACMGRLPYHLDEPVFSVLSHEITDAKVKFVHGMYTELGLVEGRSIEEYEELLKILTDVGYFDDLAVLYVKGGWIVKRAIQYLCKVANELKKKMGNGETGLIANR